MLGFQKLKKHGVEKSAFIPSPASFASFAKLFLFFLFVYVSSFTAIADAATYYVSPSGSGTTCSSGSPCTLATGLGKSLVGDDYLYLKDGTYTGTSLTIPWSGTSGHPIAIKAVNDGQAIVDGEGARVPLVISNKSYINVEGIVFQNSNDSVIKVNNGSSYINLKRLSAYNAGVGNNHLFAIVGADRVLVEDCVASQTSGVNKAGRYCYLSHSGADHNTFRRNYCKYYNHTGLGGPCAAAADYGGSYDLWENNVFDVSAMPSGCSACCQYGFYGQGEYGDTSHNKWYGNVVLGGPHVNQAVLAGSVDESADNWEIVNNVFYDFNYGVTDESSANWIIKNNTIANIATDWMTWFYKGDVQTAASGTCTNNSYLTGPTAIKVSSDGSSAVSRYNNVSGVSSQYSGNVTNKAGDKTLTPAYNTATYGKGAYLMVPPALQGQGESGADIGAEVLYRYQDGVLTNERLWPWPMEERIKNETGISVTYAGNGGLWGGTWEATKDWNEIYGGSLDTTPPAAPSGLSVL